VPKIVDHDERRRAIAEAVLRLVAREGVRGASLRSVAREAGWSTGMINHYCGDKRALLLTALREATRGVGERMASIQAHERGEDRVRALLEAGMPLDDERAATCRIFYHLSSAGINDPGLGKELASYYAWWRLQVRVAVEHGQGEGRFQAFDAQSLSDSFVGLAEGLGVQGLFDPDGMDAERLRCDLELAVDVLARATARNPNARKKGTSHV